MDSAPTEQVVAVSAIIQRILRCPLLCAPEYMSFGCRSKQSWRRHCNRHSGKSLFRVKWIVSTFPHFLDKTDNVVNYSAHLWKVTNYGEFINLTIRHKLCHSYRVSAPQMSYCRLFLNYQSYSILSNDLLFSL